MEAPSDIDVAGEVTAATDVYELTAVSGCTTGVVVAGGVTKYII